MDKEKLAMLENLADAVFEVRSEKEAEVTRRRQIYKSEPSQEVLGLDIVHFSDRNHFTDRKPEEKAKIILIVRVVPTGSVYRRLIAKTSWSCGLGLAKWPVELQKKLFKWSKDGQMWALAVKSIQALEDLSKLPISEVEAKLKKLDQ